MGRPTRKPDSSFADRVEGLVAGHGSRRKVAVAAGIDPTTLARSLDRKAFDRGTRGKLERLLAPPDERGRSRTGTIQPSAPGEVLQILQKLSKLLPEAMQELEVAMSKADSTAATAVPGIRR